MEKKEKENVIEFGGRSYGKSDAQEILQRCDLLVTDNVALMKENKSLKFQIGGYITANKNLKRKLDKANAYGREADEMYNEKLTELDECKKTILSLNSQITELNVRIGELISDNNTLKGDRDDWKELYDFYLKMPWYRRIFMRIRK